MGLPGNGALRLRVRDGRYHGRLPGTRSPRLGWGGVLGPLPGNGMLRLRVKDGRCHCLLPGAVGYPALGHLAWGAPKDDITAGYPA
jgi:hypothetical protein